MPGSNGSDAVDDRTALIGREAFAGAALQALERARRELLIVSQALEPAAYDCDGFVAPLQELLLSSPRARLRGLIADPQQVMHAGAHRLVELCLRLPSRCELRQPDESAPAPWPELLLADERCALLRLPGERLVARFIESPLEVQRLRGDFDAAWAPARPSPELRRLDL
ncbi:MAG: hypothetical protein KGJ55_01355 [Gammaproteobacteria bacterium]|nr:hypothetical protein [Gammaproteobacteria bacterium]